MSAWHTMYVSESAVVTFASGVCIPVIRSDIPSIQAHAAIFCELSVRVRFRAQRRHTKAMSDATNTTTDRTKSTCRDSGRLQAVSGELLEVGVGTAKGDTHRHVDDAKPSEERKFFNSSYSAKDKSGNFLAVLVFGLLSVCNKQAEIRKMTRMKY